MFSPLPNSTKLLIWSWKYIFLVPENVVMDLSAVLQKSSVIE